MGALRSTTMSRRKGFNWKARAGSATRSNGPYEDTNVLELPPKKQKLSEKKPEKILNRNKLSSRQKKHLQKTVERKIKKAKVTEHIRIPRACVTCHFISRGRKFWSSYQVVQ